MSMKAFFSNRVYKNTLSREYVDAISHALFSFQQGEALFF